jgi:hypothetical protein
MKFEPFFGVINQNTISSHKSQYRKYDKKYAMPKKKKNKEIRINPAKFAYLTSQYDFDE